MEPHRSRYFEGEAVRNNSRTPRTADVGHVSRRPYCNRSAERLRPNSMPSPRCMSRGVQHHHTASLIQQRKDRLRPRLSREGTKRK